VLTPKATTKEIHMTLRVRPAAQYDVPAAAAVLADAFSDYPWTRWTVDADAHDERLRDLHRLFLSAIAVPFGRADLGQVGDELVSVAVWTPSTAVPDDVWAQVAPAAARLAGNRAVAAAEAEEALAVHRIGEPHVTLSSVGVLGPHQGRGIGAATLTAGLEDADRKGLPVHLETSAEPNVRFYRRLGFSVTGVVDLRSEGPRIWLMRREPSATATGGATMEPRDEPAR
jgi:ribosomal protein S18 acetylase RimI-like enzyme